MLNQPHEVYDRRVDRVLQLPPMTRLLLTPAQRAERARLLRGRYFLVNMRGGPLGEVFRCRRCGGKHGRLTLYCLDQPFSGLSGGLFAYLETVSEPAAVALMTPPQRARFAALKLLLGGGDDLAERHPGLARALTSGGPERPQNAVDLDLGMVALGLLEPISVRDAQQLLDRINTRAALYRERRLVVPGLRTMGG